MDHKAAYLSFSQRKFIGFRQRFEFDNKRILLASQNRITLLGYHPQAEKPYEILNCPIPGLQSGLEDAESLSACLDDISDEETPQRVVNVKEQVVEVTFIMDSFPSYLLVISKIPKRNQKKPEN